ncbi:MAG: deoxyguanosinetriphosphate triphosphohydrolase [Bacteroidota bacterium]
MERMDWKKLLNVGRYGQETTKDTKDIRRPYQRDFDRIVFSSAFRRMQDKTQVFPIPQSDFVHNRLTHSLEVSSVGRSLGSLGGNIILNKENNQLDIHPESFGDIVAAACLAHDVGNPPFGHSGEKAIGAYFKGEQGQKHRKHLGKDDYWADFIHYEGNAAGFRILTNHHPKENPGGLFLTYATLGTFSKYPCASRLQNTKVKGHTSLKKFGYFKSEEEIFAEVASELGLFSNDAVSGNNWKRHPLAFLMEAADNICYRIIDLEDGYKLGYISLKEMEELLTYFLHYPHEDKAGLSKYKAIKDPGEKVGYLRAKAINALVNETAMVFEEKYEEIMQGVFDEELTDFIRSGDHFNGTIYDRNKQLYNSRKVVEIELAGYKILGGLLEAFAGILLNPEDTYNKKLNELVPDQFKAGETDDYYQRLMKMTDFVARMTDSYAINLYRKITGISLPEIY